MNTKQETPKEYRMIRYRSAILLFLFLGIFLLFFIFLVTVGKTLGNDRNTNNKIAHIQNKAIRGKIISADHFVVTYSEKKFRAEVNRRSIDPKKKNLFIKLFSIYSGMSEYEVASKFRKRKSNRVVLSENLDFRLATDLKSLSHKMSKLGIFRPLNPKKPHLVYGLDILPSSETRYFPHKNLLTPVVGYLRTEIVNGYEKPHGMKGLEKAYGSYLLPERDASIKGKADVLGTPLRTTESQKIERIDGLDIYLNIELGFQRKVEAVLDEMKKQTAAQEVMAAVMNSETGDILALASSERFDPKHIHQKDVKALHPKFSEYLYEPGSVIKPFTMAIAIDKGKVNLREQIPLGGKCVVSKTYTISDDDYFKALTPKGIIMHSSNIGISKIAWRLSGLELYNGWLNFGLSKRSGIDLSKELVGRIKPPYRLNYKVNKANTAYGYGMLATFMQLIRGYSAFNNGGVAVVPKIVNHMEDKKHRIYYPERKAHAVQACSLRAANIVNDMLQAAVNRGTGTAAQYDGLTVGGKTGTAHISERGLYVEKYHSSFFGFVNDKLGHKYTVGVFVIKPKKVYFASQTAAPTFQKIVGKMVEQGYLKVDKTLAKIHLSRREALRAKKRAIYLEKIRAYNEEHGIK